MKVDDIRALFSYSRWATARLLQACRALNPADFARDLRTSHKSVRGTLVHTMWAEWIWLQRWRGTSPKEVFAENQYPDIDAVEARWAEVERDRQALLADLTEQRLNALVAYQNLKGQHREYPLSQMMQHVVNHGSYHRGQIVALLRQLGRTPPSTDFLDYVDDSGR
jgi:uncharacterized damage-inducible protein DinB